MPVILATREGGVRDLRPAQANSSRDPIFKITRAKWTGGVAHTGEHLLSKCEALSSKPTTTKKRKEKNLPTLPDYKGIGPGQA
jgi:hypothetical protein